MKKIKHFLAQSTTLSSPSITVELGLLAVLMGVAGYALGLQQGEREVSNKIIIATPHTIRATPTTTPKPSAAPSAAKTPAPKSSVGPCGGTQARIENGNVICELTVAASILPVEVRMLAPEGDPGINVTCSDENACSENYGDQKTFFTDKTWTRGTFFVEVSKATTVTIKLPVTRHLEESKNGHLGMATFTSSYWVYGSGQGLRCCGTNPPLIYDIYNGYAESFKQY